MRPVPWFRRPSTAPVGGLLVLAMITAACSSGSSPSVASPESSPTASTAPTLAPTLAPTQAPSEPPATEPPAVDSPTPAPSATSATVSLPPPAPTGLDYGIERGLDGEGGLVMTRYTVSWSAPLDPGTSISVFGVITCPVKRSPDNLPCVTESTRLPARIRELIVMGPASDGSISWDWPEADVDGPVLAVGPGGTSYYAFVVRAINDAGRSPFVVLRSTVACSDCMS